MKVEKRVSGGSESFRVVERKIMRKKSLFQFIKNNNSASYFGTIYENGMECRADFYSPLPENFDGIPRRSSVVFLCKDDETGDFLLSRGYYLLPSVEIMVERSTIDDVLSDLKSIKSKYFGHK